MADKILNYPSIDNDIVVNKKELKNDILSRECDRKKIKIAILGGSTTAEIKNIIELYLLDNGIEPLFYESDYNQYYLDVISEKKQLIEFSPEIIYIHTSFVNIEEFPDINDSIETSETILIREYKRFEILWQKINTLFNCSIIQNNFELPPHRSLGNLDACLPQGKVNFVQRLNLLFSNASQEINNLYIQDINYLASSIGLDNWRDDVFYYSYKYALSFSAIPFLAHNFTKMICSIFGLSKKVLVVDLDNTLWGGVIADDGLDAIKIGVDSPTGEMYLDFQKYILDLKQRGVTLAVCSKNDASNASLGLSHESNVITENDFVSIKANWEPKSHSIVDIENELNMGRDSFVFFDDNPAEREIVNQHLPEVEVPEIGNRPELFLSVLDKNGYFEPINIQEEDKVREQYYKENKKRETAALDYHDYGSYLESLLMQAEIKPFTDQHLNRISQLINKTNQFNLTTERFNIQAVKEFSSNEKYIDLYGHLKDKFGDNGLVSTLVAETKSGEAHIILWLMSCRVFKRELELAMFDQLVKQCQKENIKKILGKYIPSNKNAIVEKFYEELGFDLISSDNEEYIWSLDIPEEYKNKNKYIKVSS
jgi:FkbH-like protein